MDIGARMSQSPELDENWRQHLAELLRHGHKIEAIKVYREATGAGLAEAKTFVEELERTLRAESLPQGKGEVIADLEEDLLEHLREGRKIEAIRRYRQATNAGLKEAKDAVEALAAKRGVVVPRGSGCLGVLALVLVLGAALFRGWV
jgi:ribosomal protein L7/L12